MKHSESIKEISAALAKAQSKMGAAVKDATNPHFRSKYADLASVVEAIREPLTSNGIAFTQWAEAAESGVSVITMLTHSSGEWMSGETFIPVTKADAQGYGSAITYGRRYGLQTACGLPTDDDDGNAAAKAAPERIHPAVGVEQRLGADEITEMKSLAEAVKGWFSEGKDPAEIMAELEAMNLDADMKTFMWSLLPSNIRSALKKKA